MSNFEPLLSEPDWSLPYWIKTTYGGYNRCIVIDTETGLCVPNCTGWVWGRFLMANGLTDCNLSVGDAADFYGTADGYERGSEPEVGGILCFSHGWENHGHVCFVERKDPNGEWVDCSESDYGGEKFYIRRRYRSDGWLAAGSTTRYQGTIYSPNVEPPTSGKFKLWMYSKLIKKRREEQ